METTSLVAINPKQIDFDELNPRGESVEQITNDTEFYKLKDSIKNYGLINPLIVKKQDSKDKPFLLIDGERRLRAILDLELTEVNVNTVENDINGSIIAYQIHQNRKRWERPAEAKAIKRIIVSIKAENPVISDTDLKRKLIEVTSHKPTAIDDMLKILRYSDDIVEMSQKGEIDHSYLVRIEDDFTQPLIKAFPKIVESKDGIDNIRKLMIEKAKLGLLKNTRYMMTSGFKEIFKGTVGNLDVQNLISSFLNIKSQSAEVLYEAFKHLQSRSSQNTQKEAIPLPKANQETSNTDLFFSQKESSVNENNTKTKSEEPLKPQDAHQSFYSNEREPQSQNNLKASKAKTSDFDKIKKKYETLYIGFSNEETEYLKEAFECLATQKCMKAATLMVWAATVSRMLSYIEKDISNFNLVCSAMNMQKKSFYKNYAGNFQVKASDIEHVRELSKDMQLVCFLCYEKIIKIPELKKMKAIFDKRNDCAHPTSVQLTLTEVIVVFEQLYDIVFSNSKLR